MGSPATLTSWINTTYFSVTTDDIVALQIENANGVFSLRRQMTRGGSSGWPRVRNSTRERIHPARQAPHDPHDPTDRREADPRGRWMSQPPRLR